MSGAEFSREVLLDTLGTAPRSLSIEADEAECAALARRFGLIAIDLLKADLSVARTDDGAALTGRLNGCVVQACVASAAPVRTEISEPIAILFRAPPGQAPPDEEIELGESDMDVMFITGGAIDAGEAVAQSLALALDPFPRASDADAALKDAGVKSEAEAGPFAALATLRDKPKD